MMYTPPPISGEVKSVTIGTKLELYVISQLNILKDDPSDNKFFSLAIDGKADYIISGDSHLLELKTFPKMEPPPAWIWNL